MTGLRCRFDADGWLQGPVRITHLATPNHGTGFGTGRGVVMHTENCTCPPYWGGLTPPPACPAHGQTEIYQVRC